MKKNIIVLLSLLFPLSTLASVIHVPGDQPTIQAGIDAAVNGDTVLVADGTYTGTGNRDIDFLGKAITVRSENGPDNCIVDCQGSSSDNHRGFYFHNGEGLDSILQGFTIRNGYVGDGGGIRCDNASPTIHKNIISGNNANNGGGIHLVDSSPRITYNNISGNQGTISFASSGGGINSYGGSPVIFQNTITHNGTETLDFYWGGGIYCTQASPIIVHNTITHNISKVNGGGITLQYCSSTIAHNNISNNSSYDGGPGGGIFILFFEDEALPVTINNNIIRDNVSGGGGGGIDCSYGDNSLVIANNIISSNVAGAAGIYCYESSPTITNNLISDIRGPGIQCEYSSSPKITNNTITNNALGVTPGGGINCDASSFPTVLNSIIWGNEPGQIIGSSTVTYCDVEGGYPGTGNIDADPLFVRGPLGDYYLSQISAGQSQDSPCVDSGDGMMSWPCNSYSVCGTTRTDIEPDTGIIDMGYHYPLVGIQIPTGHKLEEAPEGEAQIHGIE